MKLLRKNLYKSINILPLFQIKQFGIITEKLRGIPDLLVVLVDILIVGYRMDVETNNDEKVSHNEIGNSFKETAEIENDIWIQKDS